MDTQHDSSIGLSLANLACTFRRTTGDVPPPLVGSSVTRTGDSIYVFGGRVSNSRAMVATLFCLDLSSLRWERHWPPTESPPPVIVQSSASTLSRTSTPTPLSSSLCDPNQRAPSVRYFHSAEVWGDKLVFFGGQGPLPDEETKNPSSYFLSTLSDVFTWDTIRRVWEFPTPTCRAGVVAPGARFAHISAMTCTGTPPRAGFSREGVRRTARMSIIGGQDADSKYVQNVCCLDLDSWCWVQNELYGKRAGSYRSLAVGATMSVRKGKKVARGDGWVDDGVGAGWRQLAYSVEPTSDRPEPVLVFSNANFDDPRRELDLLSIPVDDSHPVGISNISPRMVGALPPGLRFPTGEIYGRHLVVAGLHKSAVAGESEFVFWALDLGPSGAADGVGELTWRRIDTGGHFKGASWNRSVRWGNSVVVLGSRDRDVDYDYDRRRTNFSHVAFVNLEAYGIYSPPPRLFPPEVQSLGLSMLSQPSLADFEITCTDGVRLACSRTTLEDRWPWFRRQIRTFSAKAQGIQQAQERRENDLYASSVLLALPSSPISPDGAFPYKRRRILTVTPRSLDLPLASPAAHALLQYFYTLSLGTPLQLNPSVLCQLLVFLRAADAVPNLRALVVHALHEALEDDPGLGAQVYEAATLGFCVALQIRAMECSLSPRPSPPPTSALVLNAITQEQWAEPSLTPFSPFTTPQLNSRPSFQSSLHSDSSSIHNTPSLSMTASTSSTSLSLPYNHRNSTAPAGMAAAWAAQDEATRQQLSDRARIAAEVAADGKSNEFLSMSAGGKGGLGGRRPSVDSVMSQYSGGSSLSKAPSIGKSSRLAASLKKLWVASAPEEALPPPPSRTPLRTFASESGSVRNRISFLNEASSPPAPLRNVPPRRDSILALARSSSSGGAAQPAFNYRTAYVPPLTSNASFPPDFQPLERPTFPGLKTGAGGRSASIPIDIDSMYHLPRPAPAPPLNHSPSSPNLRLPVNLRDVPQAQRLRSRTAELGGGFTLPAVREERDSAYLRG